MKNVNIVLFSSGISEKNGILAYIKTNLEQKGYNCMCWRNLFENAKDSSNIALLPMLLKKIPTFDYSLIICEGHDRTIMNRMDESIEVMTMRDNVLFEIGLCVMALGPSKVILLTDEEVRLPEDLSGINNEIALKQIQYNQNDIQSIEKSEKEISQYIKKPSKPIMEIKNHINKTSSNLEPMMIGAATGTAIGYVRNFIFRVFENYKNGIKLSDSDQKMFPSLEKLHLHIIIPEDLNEEIFKSIQKEKQALKRGVILDQMQRDINIDYKLEEGVVHIYDYPTVLTASYDTVKIILDMNADDSSDALSQERFIKKELELFKLSIEKLLDKSFIESTVNSFGSYNAETKEEKIKDLCDAIKNCIMIKSLTI